MTCTMPPFSSVHWAQISSRPPKRPSYWLRTERRTCSFATPWVLRWPARGSPAWTSPRAGPCPSLVAPPPTAPWLLPRFDWGVPPSWSGCWNSAWRTSSAEALSSSRAPLSTSPACAYSPSAISISRSLALWRRAATCPGSRSVLFSLAGLQEGRCGLGPVWISLAAPDSWRSASFPGRRAEPSQTLFIYELLNSASLVLRKGRLASSDCNYLLWNLSGSQLSYLENKRWSRSLVGSLREGSQIFHLLEVN